MPYIGNVNAAEILGPTENGNCKPLRIKDTDGQLYIVKGMAKPGRAALVSEILSVQLAERFGLSVPDYAVMHVPDDLIDFSIEPLASNLRGGVAFASRWVAGADDLTFQQAKNLPEQVQQRTLLLDVWLGNGDRELDAFSGNVNLLWTPNLSPIVFDHNLAFNMNLPEYWVEGHVFAGQAHRFRNYAVRDEWAHKIDTALADWDNMVRLVPCEWIYWDGEDRTNAAHPTIQERLEWLERYRSDPEKFWRDL
ncbi:HipA family kinase [Halomonas sp. PR-M31]|uniref:HipA family kinase n=1 Tax=Halomonas sp. PR-M31 TaxID=1471202 RepID=UPI000651C764|nr:HipA family kinase [Halomonas sp. PR-M31]